MRNIIVTEKLNKLFVDISRDKIPSKEVISEAYNECMDQTLLLSQYNILLDVIRELLDAENNNSIIANSLILCFDRHYRGVCQRKEYRQDHP